MNATLKDGGQAKTAEEGTNNVAGKSNAESESELLSGNPNNEDEESVNDEESNDIKNPCPNVSTSVVKFCIPTINPHLVCPLCNGYFRDPYTITECLHTFCKSCLFFAFQTGFRQCPTCKTDLSPDPFRLVLQDRTLSTLVHKIFPYLDVQDSIDEREFYDRRGIKRKPEFRDSNTETKAKAESSGIYDNNSKSKETKNPISAPSLEAGDEINFTLTPETNAEEYRGKAIPSLEKPLLRTSGRLKIAQLKKYLLKKLKMDDVVASNAVQIFCNGDRLGDELSLTFVFRTRWLHPNEEMTLSYKIVEDEGMY